MSAAELARRKRFHRALAELREGLAGLDAVPEAELDEATRRLRDNTRAMLDRYDRDRYDTLVAEDDA